MFGAPVFGGPANLMLPKVKPVAAGRIVGGGNPGVVGNGRVP